MGQKQCHTFFSWWIWSPQNTKSSPRSCSLHLGQCSTWRADLDGVSVCVNIWPNMNVQSGIEINQPQPLFPLPYTILCILRITVRGTVVPRNSKIIIHSQTFVKSTMVHEVRFLYWSSIKSEQQLVVSLMLHVFKVPRLVPCLRKIVLLSHSFSLLSSFTLSSPDRKGSTLRKRRTSLPIDERLCVLSIGWKMPACYGFSSWENSIGTLWDKAPSQANGNRDQCAAIRPSISHYIIGLI